MPVRVIAIDGPAGSGKSTTAREVAARLNLSHLDSGALYRAVTLMALQHDVPVAGPELASAAGGHEVQLVFTGGRYCPFIAGREVTHDIRLDRVTELVSRVAALPEVREWVNGALRRAAQMHPRGVVVDGRDIGTVVFPDAAVKIFLVASKQERARRRALQLGLLPDDREIQRVAGELTRRDEADSSREHAPLKPADDALVIDTTDLTFREQVQQVVAAARDHFPQS